MHKEATLELTDDEGRSYHSEVVKRLIFVRNVRKLTQRQVCDLAGIPLVALSNIERDRQKLSLNYLFKLAMALKINVRVLLPRGDWPQELLPKRCYKGDR